MEREVLSAKFFLRTVEHGADAARFYIEGFSKFFVGKSVGTQYEQLRLRRFDSREHAPHLSTLFLTQCVLQWPVTMARWRRSNGSLFVLPPPVRSSQSINAQVRRCPIEPPTDIAVGL